MQRLATATHSLMSAHPSSHRRVLPEDTLWRAKILLEVAAVVWNRDVPILFANERVCKTYNHVHVHKLHGFGIVHTWWCASVAINFVIGS